MSDAFEECERGRHCNDVGTQSYAILRESHCQKSRGFENYKMLEQESCAICFGKFCNTHFARANKQTTLYNIIMGNHVAKNTSTNATMAPKEATAFIQHEISTHQVRAWRRSSCCIIMLQSTVTHTHSIYIHYHQYRWSFSRKVIVVTVEPPKKSLKACHKQMT